MLDRIASTVMGRSWAFSAAALGFVIGLTIATAPKPSCKCTGARPATVEQEIATAARMVMSPRASYLALMRARAIDVQGAHAETIDLMLAHVAPHAAQLFVELEDYENAAAAILVAEEAAR